GRAAHAAAPGGAEIHLEVQNIAASQKTALGGPVRRVPRFLRQRVIPFRKDPALLAPPPMKPPRFHFGLPLRAATIWSNLDDVGVTDVVGVWQHVAQLMTVVAIR